MKCDKCKKDVGMIIYKKDIGYCENCLKSSFDIRYSHQYYKKLFVKCPFCNEEIDITDNGNIEECPNCKVNVKSPSYCGFCEEEYAFDIPLKEI